MGCGGSRADAIEPRYYESWTRETESTWLTSTDSEAPQEGSDSASRESGLNPLNPPHHWMGDTPPPPPPPPGTLCSRLGGAASQLLQVDVELLEDPCACPLRRILEDSKSTQTCVTKSSAANEIACSERRTHCGTQCTKSSVHTSGTLAQKQQNGFRTEAKWDSKKKSTKDITINAAKTIRQIKSNRRLTKNSVN